MGTNVTRTNLSSTDFINDREYRYSANGFRDSATVTNFDTLIQCF